jgi:hypothetical protein
MTQSTCNLSISQSLMTVNPWYSYRDGSQDPARDQLKAPGWPGKINKIRYSPRTDYWCYQMKWPKLNTGGSSGEGIKL